MDSDDRMDRHPILDVRLLGGFAVRVGGRLVPTAVWGQRRAAAIVKLLALEPGYRLHREQVLDVLWPELDPDSAANNLRVALHHARGGLAQAGAPPGRFLIREGDVLVLGARTDVLVDVEVFARAVALAWQQTGPQAAEDAAALYTGDLLPDDPYEEWAEARREAIRASYLTLLTRLSGLYEARSDLSRALATRERTLAVDALDEGANAAIVRLHAAMGRHEVALAHYARFAARLQRELGVAPEHETREMAAAIREGRVPAALPLQQPPPGAPSLAIASPLPAALDALVGRERELAELGRLLAGARLVTLTGPGGIGKTRLALETARATRARYPDGVAMADLAALRDPALALPTVARALGIDFSGGQPLDALQAAIGGRRLLVVLDNLEQIAAAGADVAALLASCPELTVLATSRVRLRVRGEQEYAVSPLPLPAPSSEAGRTLASLAEAPAVALFVRRAQAARPDFRLTGDNVDAVVAICRRLDGLPLAIELAAARVRMLTPGELLRRLARPLDVLGLSAADAPQRQRTLRDTIAWSYDLLASDERRVFRLMGVFSGGWSLAAAEVVSGDRPVLDALGGLVDQSLVIARRGGAGEETRFAMLETIREFAAEQLLASGERDAAQWALEAYLLELVEAAERGFLGPEQSVWLDRLQTDHDNLRATLAFSLERGDAETAMALASALAPFWRARGFAAEGVRWLERSLDSGGDAPAAACAAALDALGGLLIDLGEFARADRAFRDSVDHWLKLGERRAVAQGLFALSIARGNSGDIAGAQDALEESLAIAQDLDDDRGVAAALHNLGMLAREAGELDRAITLLDAAMTLWRRVDDPHWIGVAAGNLGDAYRLAGEPERAQGFLDESERRYATLGDRFGLGVVANQRGLLDQAAGRDAAAMQRHAEALRHFDAVQAPLGVIESIEWLAVAAAGAPDARDALRLFGAAEAARAARGLAPLAADAAPIAAGLAWARQTVGPDAGALLAEGAALPLDAARDAALALADARRLA